MTQESLRFKYYDGPDSFWGPVVIMTPVLFFLGVLLLIHLKEFNPLTQEEKVELQKLEERLRSAEPGDLIEYDNGNVTVVKKVTTDAITVGDISVGYTILYHFKNLERMPKVKRLIKYGEEDWVKVAHDCLIRF